MAIWITDPYPDTDPDADRDTGRMCLGGGIHCPSAASSCLSNLFISQTKIFCTDVLKQQLIEVSCPLELHDNCGC